MKISNLITIALIALATAIGVDAQTTQVDSWSVWPTAAYTTVDATSGTGVLSTTNSATFSYSANYIYTGSNTPTLTLTLDTLSGVDTIIFEINYSGTFGVVPSLEGLAADSVLTASGSSILSNPATYYTYTWDVSGLTLDSTFDITWTTTAHNAFDFIRVTQSAVPEPSTYAAIVGGLALAGVMILRRRRA